jgi:poly-gamma-glutamate synthesis protein (capsule biosynthesis protein)
MDGLMAEVKYDKGELREIILHPISLGLGLPKSQMGMPRLPSPQDAQRILQRVKKLSEPFGTKISIENNLGIIRVAAAK